MDSYGNELKCVNCEVPLPYMKQDYIRCVDEVCKQENVVLCVKCFSMGAECGMHQRSHPYKVEPADRVVVLPSKLGGRHWSAEEDEQLIALAAQYKCGAWDEVAKTIGHNISAKEAMLRFDEHFIRGPMGRHASSNKYWPYIDDRTGAYCLSHDGNVKSNMATGPSEWQYIVEGIRHLDEELNVNDISWREGIVKRFQQFKEDYEEANSFPIYTSDTVITDNTSEKPSSSNDLNNLLAFSPVKVKFLQKMDNDACQNDVHERSFPTEKSHSTSKKRNKRLVSSSSEELETNIVKKNWSDSESNESAEIGISPSTSHVSSRRRSFVHLGMQSSDEEELNGTLFVEEKQDKKGVAKYTYNKHRHLEKNSRKIKSVGHDLNSRLEESDGKNSLTVQIEDEDRRKLRNIMPKAFFNTQQPLPGTSAEGLKAKSDDLQLLGYWPGRDDYDIEQANDAEKMISQVVISAGSTFDEQFENAVKMANIRAYNLVLSARNASKAMIREHGLVDLFFDKIMDVNLGGKYRAYVYNKQYYFKQRSRKHYADLLKPLHQVTLSCELEDLIDNLAVRDTLLARINELKKLKDEGVTLLPGHLKGDIDSIRVKRKRKTFGTSRRKGVLKYERLKRWTQKHAESDD
uniref:Myb-like domain-containing protein n=1 Tax=Syphacia muris TaxID=451379 RepID=A0A0N5ASU8_9BILA